VARPPDGGRPAGRGLSSALSALGFDGREPRSHMLQSVLSGPDLPVEELPSGHRGGYVCKLSLIDSDPARQFGALLFKGLALAIGTGHRSGS
jgi:hypothetical protein